MKNKALYKRALAAAIAGTLLFGSVPASEISAAETEEEQIAEIVSGDTSETLTIEETETENVDGTEAVMEVENVEEILRAADSETDDGYTYQVSGSSATITGYNGTDVALEIPGIIKNSDGSEYTVTSIGSYAFAYSTSFTSVTVPESVTVIGNYAFSNCTSLKEVIFQENSKLTTIAISAFKECNGLTTITIPSGVSTINDSVFYYCKSLKSVILPENLTTIGKNAFALCESLTDINLPESLTAIGESAFSDCKSLTGINLPESLTTIDRYAFSNCKSLTGIHLPEKLTTIGQYTFHNCTGLADITIPTGVTTIEQYAFAYCTGLKRVEIKGAASLQGYSFASCSSLTQVVVGNKEAEFNNNSFISYDSRKLVIYGYSGSTAQTFAKNESYAFVKLDAENPLSDCTITLAADSYTYTGSAFTPEVTVKNASVTLTEGTDYTVSYENNTNAGTAAVIIKGLGSYTSETVNTYGEGRYYTGSETKTFTIAPKEINDCTAVLENNSYPYTGREILPALTMKNGTVVMTEGTDYTVSYSDNINTGTATVIITGIGNYTGNVQQTFRITKVEIDDCKVSLEAESFYYTGSPITPEVTVTNGDVTLEKDKDYMVSYSSNINEGTATVTIQGTGNYTGSTTRNFEIIRKNISICDVSSVEDQLYTGKELNPGVTVKDGETKLTEGTDYILSYKNNKDAGTATITITGQGKYTGSTQLTFKIVKTVSGVKAVSASYNSIKVSWNEIKSVTGYKVYRSTSKNGDYKLVKTLKDSTSTSYTDTKLTTGTTYYYKVMPYKSSKNGKASKVVSAKAVLEKAAITSAKNSAKKTVKLTWNKVSGASGYEVYRSTSKNGAYKLVKTVTSGSSYKDTKLSKGKTYYYKVRAYRTVDGEKVYGSYSSVKKVKISK